MDAIAVAIDRVPRRRFGYHLVNVGVSTPLLATGLRRFCEAVALWCVPPKTSEGTRMDDSPEVDERYTDQARIHLKILDGDWLAHLLRSG